MSTLKHSQTIEFYIDILFVGYIVDPGVSEAALCLECLETLQGWNSYADLTHIRFGLNRDGGGLAHWRK